MAPRSLLLCLLVLLLAVAPATAHEAHVTHGDTIRELNFDFVAAIENGDSPGIASTYGDAGLTYMPLRWCGTQRSTDDTANAAYDASLPQVKFVYAYASDQVNRSAQWADLLQANASLISRFYAQQSGGLRAPRFDLGTDCGADYVDIATVALPNPRASYVGSFNTLQTEVNALLPRTSGQPRNYVILADKLSPHAAGSLWGQGSLYGSDAKGTGNIHNAGGLSSIIWVPEGQNPSTTESGKDQGFWPEGFLHEMTHNYGGVQNGSPNSTTAGHCRDGRDVMCYADGGLSYDPNVCAIASTFTTSFVQTLDCGRDDYFSPSPTPSSWLDTHFNTFDSVFNGDCAGLGNQCGGGVAPKATAVPAVTGTARQGKTLTAGLGTWSGGPALTWQWEEEVSGTWQPFASDSLTLTLSSAHIGRRYRLKVTATGAETVVVRSHPTALVTGPVAPSATARPVVTGTTRYGETLTATPGTWNNAVSYAYQWLRYEDGGNYIITGATSATYVLGRDDLGLAVRVLVTATSEDGLTSQSTSLVTGTIVSAPVNDSAPVLSGTAKVGRNLSGTYGSWTSPWTQTLARQWQREVAGEWTAIGGATASSYTLTADDVGARVRLLVTATNQHGSTSVASAATTAVAALAPPVNTVAPLASGDAQQGNTLTVGGDAWTGATSYAIRWERRPAGGDWSAISGATARTYVLTATDVDADVRAVVTATNADGSTAATSNVRGPVVTNVAPGNTVLPAITGVAQVGMPLTADTGTWLRANSYAYAWQRLAGGSWSAIEGATASSYTPAPTDAGLPLRVVVTATGWGGGTTAQSAQTAAVAHPPVLVSGPAITGTTKRGRTLTASPGDWTNATTYAYRWERMTDGTWSEIASATAATYVPVAADVGRTVRVKVTASNATDSSSPVASDATAVIADLEPPINTAAPAATGTAKQGQTLTAGSDAWTGADSTSVVWERRTGTGAWTPIAGATSRTYVLAAADVDNDVRAVVTAINLDGTTSVSTAARGPVLTSVPPANSTLPQVTGTPRAGELLTTSNGAWQRADTYTYAWERLNGDQWAAIAGATASTYTPVAADAGKRLRAVVTATGPGGSTSVASGQTDVVVDPPVLAAAPAVTGAAKRTQTLTASTGGWTNATTYAFQWQRRVDGVWTAISGATGDTYVPVAGDVAHLLRVRVIASNATGSSAPAYSDATSAVSDLEPPVKVSAPVITGTLYEGETLTAGVDEWTGAISVSVVWQRRVGTGEWTGIAGATGRTYVLTTSDRDANLRVVLTATNGDGESVEPSQPRGPVDADPVNLTRPVITGTAKVGRQLWVGNGTWARASNFATAWQRRSGEEWIPIAGAVSTTYTPVESDAGLLLRAVVTGTGTRASATATSDPTPAVAVPAPPVSSAAPVVAGTPQAGQNLTVGGDTWELGDTLRVQWQRRPSGGAWADIAGAISRSYSVVAGDVGADLRAVVTAANADGETSVPSGPRGPVEAAPVTPVVTEPTPSETVTATPPAEAGTPASSTTPAVVAPPVIPITPKAVRAEVLVKAGKKPAGKLVLTITAGKATVSGAKLKARNGRYTLKVCAATRCATVRVKVTKGKLSAAKLTLPAMAGTMKLTLKPAAGKPLTGKLVL
jgi:hypothetical protein